jgi:hypothetical protein
MISRLAHSVHLFHNIGKKERGMVCLRSKSVDSPDSHHDALDNFQSRHVLNNDT